MTEKDKCMKIAFAGQPLLEEEKTGIGYYTEGLIQNIMRKNLSDKYYINIFSYKNPEESKEKIRKYEMENTNIEVCSRIPLTIYKLIWNIVPIPYHFLFKQRADITHFFNYYIPPFVSGKRVCTIHDMTIKAYPETVRFKSRIMMRLNLRTTCKRATRIVTSSEFSKSEIVKYLKISPKKISVLYSGVNLSLYKPCLDSSLILEIKRKYGIIGDYFIYLGTLEPRKNIVRMIQAYSLLKSMNKDVPKLVIAGRKGWMYKDIFELIQNEKLEANVILTGYIAQTDTPILLNGAKAFVFPSLYEGFGMPPLEAMACGTPVITSNCSSLPEVVGDAAILVDPYKIDEIAAAMNELSTNDTLRNELSQKGIKRASLFSWDRISDSLHKIYEQVMEEDNEKNKSSTSK